MLRTFILLSFFAFFLLFTNSRAEAQEKKFFEVNPDSLINFAEKFIGTPYVWAGNQPGGFDCSGFVYYIYQHFGKTTTLFSYEFPKFGEPISIDRCKTGDIILFSHEKSNSKKIGHVGLVISKLGEPLTFIQASSSKKHGGVVITTFKHSMYERRFIEIIRLTT